MKGTAWHHNVPHMLTEGREGRSSQGWCCVRVVVGAEVSAGAGAVFTGARGRCRERRYWGEGRREGS